MMTGSRPWSLTRTAAALLILALCTCDRTYATASKHESSLRSIDEAKGNNYTRKLGKAVPARPRGYTRTTTNQWGSSWSSGTQIIPNNRGSKSSKSSSKGGKSGKAQSPTTIQQIIVYVPSPTKMPISVKPTISPKPTASPTVGPTGMPSESPSMAPSALASEAPSDEPSSLPSVHPTAMASEVPSDEPSSYPSLHPSGMPSVSPSLRPSNLPSIAPSDLPSTEPSTIPSMKPTQVPTASPESFDVSTMPSRVGLKSPEPTVEELDTPTPSILSTDKPTKQGKTVKPSPVATEDGSSVPTMTTTSPEPTVSVSTNSEEPTPAEESNQPTVEATSGPTGTIVDERQNLRMQLFGIEVLTPDLIKTYERETEAYIENFYNNYTGSDEVRDGVRGVIAKLIVTNWTEPIDPSLERSLSEGQRLFPVKKIAGDDDLTAENKAKVIVLDVTEPCTGEAPLTVSFTLELEYRTEDPELNHLDVVISSPFMTVESRGEYIGDYLQSNDEFSTLYCSSRVIFPDGESMAPTPAITDEATGVDATDERGELTMLLYGIDLLTTARIKTYQEETAAYIEDYYNNYTDSDGLRAKVNDVSATVKVTDWTQPSNPLMGAKRIFPRKIGKAVDLTAEDKAKVVVLDVSEPCVGESPLTVVFTLELEYRVDDPKLDGSDLIISSPFQTVDARSVYIDDYLQSEGDFNSLYCSSRIMFADGRTPTPTALGGMTPSPSVVNASSTPTITSVPTENLTESIMPTLATTTTSIPTITNGTASPTSDASSMPTYNGTSNATMSSFPSLAPSILNGTLTPTVANATNISVVPTPAPFILNASIAPSVLNASVAPSVLNGSIAPTILNASVAPTVLNGSVAPTILNASIAPTINNSTFNDTLAPSISPNATSLAPSIFVSAAPTATLPPWEMRLYGLTEELVEASQALYDERTAVFIESYYNGVNNEGIQGQISDMEATVEIVGQVPPPITRSYLEPREPAFQYGIRRHRSKKHSDEGSLSFLPNEHHFDFGDRYLQEDPCSGPFLLLRMKITITYVTLDTNLTSDEVLLAAFSTEEARDDYLNNYLQVGVAGDVVFGNVTCASELFETSPKSVVPTPAPNVTSAAPTPMLEGNTSLAPSMSATNNVVSPTNDFDNVTSLVPTIAVDSNVTTSIAPTPSNASAATGTPTVISVIPDNSTSVSPTLIANITTTDDEAQVDDIFGDPTLKSVRASSSHDRKCSNVDKDAMSNTEEIPIKFVYGIESKSIKDFFIGDLEEVILDFLTTSILRCDESVFQAAIQPRMNRQVMDFGVIRIRYPESGGITSITKSCDATLSEAQECLVLSTTVLVTASESRVVEVHRAVLAVLQDAFSKGIFSEFVSDLILASYLGPDANTFHVSLSQEDSMPSAGGVAIAVLFSVVVAFGAALWVLIASTRRKRYNSVAGSPPADNNLAIYRDDEDFGGFSNHSRHSRSLIE